MNALDLAIGFTSSPQESSPIALQSEGAIPNWLSGSLLRTGPALFEVGDEAFAHWFDGLAKLHRFAFDDGKVEYTSKFLQSNAYKGARQTGRIQKREFGTEPKSSVLARIKGIVKSNFTDNGNVNVCRFPDSRYVAMTETPVPLEFQPNTLDTLGPFEFNDDLNCQVSTAHPHAGRRGEIYNVCTTISARSFYHFVRIEPDSTCRRVLASIPVSKPGYIHSFALTENYFILVESPLTVEPLQLLLSGKPFIENFKWNGQHPSRFIIVSHSDPTKPARVIECEPFFVFHHVNAYEQRGEIIVDLLAYPDSTIVDCLYLNNLKEGRRVVPEPELRRYTIHATAQKLAYERSGHLFELPRINYSDFNTRQNRYIYGLTSYGNGDFLQDISKFDLATNDKKSWHEDGCYASEPVFVQRTNSGAEDDGVLMSIVLDCSRQKSFLLILDAAKLDELSRAYLPHHVPFHFHGQFFGGIK